MTEEEWKAFNKSPGVTVWIPNVRYDSLAPWAIEKAYPNGATVYQEGEFCSKNRKWCPYAMLRSETQKVEFEKVIAEKRAKYERETQCVICEKPFMSIMGKEKTCSPECHRKMEEQRRKRLKESCKAQRQKRIEKVKENKND